MTHLKFCLISFFLCFKLISISPLFLSFFPFCFFLCCSDYNNTTDLHIAVTTSTGCVVEFDRHGLRRHRTDNMSEWWQCLLVGDVPEPWYDYWDQVLFEVSFIKQSFLF